MGNLSDVLHFLRYNYRIHFKEYRHQIRVMKDCFVFDPNELNIIVSLLFGNCVGFCFTWACVYKNPISLVHHSIAKPQHIISDWNCSTIPSADAYH